MYNNSRDYSKIAQKRAEWSNHDCQGNRDALARLDAEMERRNIAYRALRATGVSPEDAQEQVAIESGSKNTMYFKIPAFDDEN